MSLQQHPDATHAWRQLVEELVDSQPSAEGFERVHALGADQRRRYNAAVHERAVALTDRANSVARATQHLRLAEGDAEELLAAALAERELHVECALIGLSAAQEVAEGDLGRADLLALARVGYGTLLQAWAVCLVPVAADLCGGYEAGISPLEAAIGRVYTADPNGARATMLRGARATMLRSVQRTAVPQGLGLALGNFRAVQDLRNEAAREILRRKRPANCVLTPTLTFRQAARGSILSA